MVEGASFQAAMAKALAAAVQVSSMQANATDLVVAPRAAAMANATVLAMAPKSAAMDDVR